MQHIHGNLVVEPGTRFGVVIARFNEFIGSRLLAGFEDAIVSALAEPGPAVIVARIEPGSSTGRPQMDCAWIKHRFMAALGLQAVGKR